jgi:hypothetical protein
MTRSLAGDQAETYLRIPRGGFALRGKGVYYDIGPRDTLSIAAHEGWHQYTQATFRHPLPLWLEEGIAAYFEGFRWDRTDRTLPVFLPWSNPQRFDTLREAVAADTLMPLRELLVSRPQDLLERTDGRRAGLLRAGLGARPLPARGGRREIPRRARAPAARRRGGAALPDPRPRSASGTRGRPRLGPAHRRRRLPRLLQRRPRRPSASTSGSSAPRPCPGTRGDMTQGRSPVTAR